MIEEYSYTYYTSCVWTDSGRERGEGGVRKREEGKRMRERETYRERE